MIIRETRTVMADGYTPYWTGVQCDTCGRFVGRDGHVEIEHFEMSSVVASISGECARCLGTIQPEETS